MPIFSAVGRGVAATAVASTVLLGALTGTPATAEAAQLASPGQAHSDVRAAQKFDPYSIAIPAMCQHDAARLVRGMVDYGVDQGGASLGGASLVDLAPTSSQHISKPFYAKQSGKSREGAVAAVPIECNAGGVGWPETIAVYSASGALLASVNLGDLVRREHAGVAALALSGDRIEATWTAYDGAGDDITWTSASFNLRGGQLVENRAFTNHPDANPATFRSSSSSVAGVVDAYGFDSPSHNIACGIYVSHTGSGPRWVCFIHHYSFKNPPAPHHCNKEIAYGGLIVGNATDDSGDTDAGKVRYSCYGDEEVPNQNGIDDPHHRNHVLRVGERVTIAGVQCAFRSSSGGTMRCVNLVTKAAFSVSSKRFSLKQPAKV